MLICLPKINFISDYFLEIVHVKESCNLICKQHFGLQIENQNTARCGTGGRISITLLVFISNYLEKLMVKLFKKTEKPSIEHSYLLKLVVFVLPNHAIVRIGVSPPPPQKYHPAPFLFWPRPSHKPTNFSSPFSQFPLNIGFSWNPVKIQFFSKPLY